MEIESIFWLSLMYIKGDLGQLFVEIKIAETLTVIL